MNTDKNDPKQGITSAEYLEATDWVAHGIERLTDNPFAIRLAKALRHAVSRECKAGEEATARAVAAEREACAQMAEDREDIPLAMRIRARGEAPK